MEPANATIHTVASGRGADWLRDAFSLFMQAPGPWVGACVLWLVAAAALHLLPLVGALAVNLTLPVVAGGLMLGADAQREGRPFTIDYLWAAFRAPHFTPLLLLGVFTLLATMVIGALTIAAVGASVLGGLVAGDPSSVEIGFSAILALLVMLVLLVPLSMALWFAPALVALGGLEPIPALKASLRGCLVNVGPFLVYGLLTLLIAIAATIPFGLGWLVALPVMVASTYFGYRDIFAAPVAGIARP